MGLSYAQISILLGRPRSSISSFVSMYKSSHKLFPKRGRKPIMLNFVHDVTSGLENDPFLTLKRQAADLNISHETIRKIRKRERYSYFKVKDAAP